MGALVPALLVELGVVVPVAQTVAALPGTLDDGVGCAALHVPHEGLLLLLAENLAEDHLFALVVELGSDLQTHVADGIKRQHGGVEIKQIGLVATYGVHRAQLELADELLRGLRTVFPAPDAPRVVAPGAVAEVVLLTVEALRIEAAPPLVRAVGVLLVAVLLREPSVVFHADFVALNVETARGFIPGPGVVGMEGDAEGQSVFLSRFRPSLQDVLLGADVDGVPLLILRVPEVEVVVVVAQSEEILRPHLFFIELHQSVRVPVFGLPQGQDVLEAHLRRMAVVTAVEIRLTGALFIEPACHPVARTLHTLRPPVGPDAELDVAEPLRHFIRAQTLPVGLKSPERQTQAAHEGCENRFPDHNIMDLSLFSILEELPAPLCSARYCPGVIPVARLKNLVSDAGQGKRSRSAICAAVSSL